MKDAKYKYAMKGGRRSALLRLCRRLYVESGHPEGIKTVKGMVAVLSGGHKGQKGSWLWLLEQYESGKRGHPVTTSEKTTKIVRSDAKEFYSSEAWRKARFAVLKDSNGSCCLCGRSNREHGVVLHVDHIKPRSKYPALALSISNLQVLCEDCNMGKGNRDETDWRVATDIDRSLDGFDWRTF